MSLLAFTNFEAAITLVKASETDSAFNTKSTTLELLDST